MPLKDEHKSFLLRALVPLYRPRHIESYVDMLSYCVTQFVEKEAGLAKAVILGMLAGWPKPRLVGVGLLLHMLLDGVDCWWMGH